MEVDRTLLREMLALAPRERIETILSFDRNLEIALRTFQQYGVRFVVVGEVSARVHGAPTTMAVLQICYDDAVENCDALERALAALSARARIGADPFDGKVDPRGELKLATSAGFIDCVGTGYSAAVSGATELEVVAGLPVLIAAQSSSA